MELCSHRDTVLTVFPWPIIIGARVAEGNHGRVQWGATHHSNTIRIEGALHRTQRRFWEREIQIELLLCHHIAIADLTGTLAPPLVLQFVHSHHAHSLSSCSFLEGSLALPAPLHWHYLRGRVTLNT